MRLRRETLEVVLEGLQRALDELREDDLGASLADAEGAIEGDEALTDIEESSGGDDDSAATSLVTESDGEADRLCGIIKSTSESPPFFQKIDEIQKSFYQNDAVDIDTSWNIIKAVDLWEGDDSATYISSLKTVNEWSPDQIRKALKKTFQLKREKCHSSWHIL
ncbi:hypothetical protein GUJ93_ZPchr0002g25299 [Zizania palustris]|uniref:Uncharacterized protein n=1 Tax=Zizania palustris TaxID=103762 RepID=A0A8J5V3J7_ZIZPA|nr:hypothetical protein GUJ93_ZPchr0002g25299 [Zizania palustris]